MSEDEPRRSPPADAPPALAACLASLARELAHRVGQAEAELPGLAGGPLDAAREAALVLLVHAATIARVVEARWLADRATPELANVEQPGHRRGPARPPGEPGAGP